jgi:ubiquinone/menaquinone biosynthesis C-methylase UbiE
VTKTHNHPLFARWYNFITATVERKGYGELRERALSRAHGHLVAVGIGPGYDLLHLPKAVTRVTGVDPDPTMRRIAAQRASRLDLPVERVAGAGERLPLEDACADTVLLALVLCTVSDQAAVLAETRRVLRPGGDVLVLEHVRDADGSKLARWQDRLALPWAAFGGGCRPNRRTWLAFEQAGFDTTELAEARVPGLPPLIRPHLHGCTRPGPAGTAAATGRIEREGIAGGVGAWPGPRRGLPGP